MAKGPVITDEILVLAAKFHEEHPKLKNQEIRNLIWASVHDRDKELPEHKRMPQEWPSKYVIDRIMPEIRKGVERHKLEPDAHDKPWTTQSLVKYPITPDALPSVLEVWFFVQNFKSEYKTVPSMTIRQAQWVARLYCAIKDTKALLTYSQILADFERQAEIAGLDYFSSQWTTLEVFSQMTGRKFTHNEMEKITGLSGHYVTRVESFGLERIKQGTKERKNERKHQKTRQT